MLRLIPVHRIAGFLVGFACLAQQATIRTNVPLVIVPATVTDRKGHYIDGLGPRDFVLLDNGKRQKFQLDTSDTTLIPISIVIAVQADGPAAPAIAKLHKVGSMIQPLITGDRGEAAVVTFADDVNVVQNFTSSPFRISDAFEAIRATDSNPAHLIDAVEKAVQMLAARPANRRKVILLVSESRDRGSKAKLGDTIEQAQREDVTIYTASYSAYATAFTQKGSEVGPPQSGGIDFIAIFRELSRNAKANAAEAFAKYTGGRHLSFEKLRGLENTISRVGEELHSQYLLSFTPTSGEPGFHTITVQLPGRPDALIDTRPGYWPAARAE
jgi:VWFA-related protein